MHRTELQHTLICLSHSILQREASLFILTYPAEENSLQSWMGCFSSYLPYRHTPGCLAQPLLLSSSLVPLWEAFLPHCLTSLDTTSSTPVPFRLLDKLPAPKAGLCM